MLSKSFARITRSQVGSLYEPFDEQSRLRVGPRHVATCPAGRVTVTYFMDYQVSKASRASRTARPARTLRVAPADGTLRMSTAAGDPIWPYGDAETLVALTRIAELFDSSIVKERPRAAVGAARRRREGTVMSVGAETGDVALLYAHLTNRRFADGRDEIQAL